MRRCVSCNEDADYIWQPFGPGETPAVFVRPGYHARGFPALPLCDECKTFLETDGPHGPHLLRFTYRKVPYYGTRYLVDVDARANHNRVLEELKAETRF
jgi:hypothetical protein